MPVTTLGANQYVTAVTSSSLYLALLTAMPSDTDTGSTITEVTGGGYSRKTLTSGNWTSPVLGKTTYTVAQTYTSSSLWSGICVAYALCSASSGGNLLFYGSLDPIVNVASGGVLTIPANSLGIEAI
jgi:hypothetical protein